MSPTGQLVPDTMIDEAGRKFHRDVSGKWAAEDQFSTQRAIEYRPGQVIDGAATQVTEVEDLNPAPIARLDVQ